MRYPEQELVSVPAERVYYEPAKPFLMAAPEREPGVMFARGRASAGSSSRPRTTAAYTIKEEQTTGALEVMSRFATDPRWLVYLPPTMSPHGDRGRGPGISSIPGRIIRLLPGSGRHRARLRGEAHGLARRRARVAGPPARFQAPEGWRGAITTRTGRPFFDEAVERELLAAIDAAAERAGLWDELDADWILLDGEIMPWGLKAGDLIRDLYASVAASGIAATQTATKVLDRALAAGLDVAALRDRTAARAEGVDRFRDA